MGKKKEENLTDTSTAEGKKAEKEITSETKTSKTEETLVAKGKETTSEEKPKFTQEQVNKMLGETRSDGNKVGAKKAIEEILKATGSESIEKLTETVKAFEDKQREEMSELEKLQTDLAESLKKLNESEEFGKLAEQTAINAHAKSSVINAAAAKFQDGEAVWKLLNKDDIKVDMENGTVAGVEEALTKLAEKYPFLLRKKGASVTSATNPANAQTAGRTDEVRHAEYFGMGSNPFWGGQGTRRVTIDE